jgi:DNA-binding IclR family transcriptional regulator
MPPAPTPKRQGVNAAERAFAVLDAFIGNGSRSLADLAKATELAKPTVLRLLVSLERSGYVVRLTDGRYQLGAKLMQLGATYRGNFRLDQHVLPVLEQLAAVTLESAAFHIREGEHRMLLFRVESTQSVRDFSKPASLVPLDETSTGRVLRTGPGDRPVPVYASAGVYDAQTASVSTAVFAAGPALAGALTVSGPIGRFDAAQVEAIAGHLAAAAWRLSTVLGAPFAEPATPPAIVRL